MPKVIPLRQTTAFYSKRVANILATSLEIAVPCSRYKKEGLKCVPKLTTGYCAYYIRARARCSLVFSNTKCKEINDAQGAKELQLLRAKAKASQLKLEIAELKAKKRKRELKEIVAIEELERLEDEAGMPKDLLLLEPVTRTANLTVLDSRLFANLGQLQANLTLFVNPSFFNALFQLPNQDSILQGSLNRIPLLESKLPVLLGA